MKQIAIDVDGILRDYVGSVNKTLKERGIIPVDFNPDITKYEIANFYTEYIRKEDFYKVLDEYNQDIFGRVTSTYPRVLNEYTLLYLWTKTHKHTITIATNQNSYQKRLYTLQWLYSNQINYDNILFVNKATQKGITEWDIILDDNPEVLKYTNLGTTCYLMDRDWNRGIEGNFIRVYSIKDFLDKISQY